MPVSRGRMRWRQGGWIDSRRLMEILLRIKRAKGERRGGESDERCHTSAIRKVYHSISFDSSLNSRTEILQQFRSKQLYKLLDNQEEARECFPPFPVPNHLTNIEYVLLCRPARRRLTGLSPSGPERLQRRSCYGVPEPHRLIVRPGHDELAV
jgi:hypothetical protein